MTTKKAAETTPKQTVKRKKAPAEKTLAQIFKEQGVKPFDPGENGKNWPKGADYQEFVKAIHRGKEDINMTTKKSEKEQKVTRKQPSKDIEIVHIDSIERLKKEVAKRELRVKK